MDGKETTTALEHKGQNIWDSINFVIGSRSRITRVVSGFESTLLFDALDFGETVESSPRTIAAPVAAANSILTRFERVAKGLLMVDVVVEPPPIDELSQQ